MEQNPTVFQQVEKFPALDEESFITLFKRPSTTCPYPEPDESNLLPLALLL